MALTDHLKKHRILAALLIFAGWILINLLGGIWNSTGVPRPQLEAISAGIAWQILAAGLFVLLITRWLGWADVGWTSTNGWTALRLAWLPSLYILLFAMVVFVFGPPPLGFVLIVLVNCLFVGFSEELMFRGVIFSALASRWRIWPAIVICSLFFGAIHSLNVFGTGQLFIALVQSVAASLSGLFLIALRLRTGSLWPPIVFHALWNFVLLIAGGAAMGQVDITEAAANAGMKEAFMALAFQLPIALYALYLLRRIHRVRAEL